MRPGYKLTDVGEIPEDWDVKKLSDITSAGPKNGFSGRTGDDARGTQTLRLTATTSGFLILNDETVKRLDITVDARSDLFLEPGDVLIQRSNTLELVGTTAVYEGPAGTYVYPDLMMRLRFRDKSTAHWFWRYANSRGGRRFFQSVAAGSTGSMPKISGAKLRGMSVPLPALPERRAITKALSDVDEFIRAMDELVAKKRDIKQAAIQQLLSGQLRLPGFDRSNGRTKQTDAGVIPEDWEARPLLTTVRIAKGQVDPRVEPYKSMILVAPDHIEGHTGRLLEQKTASEQNAISGKYLFEAGDIIYSKIRPYLRKAFLANFRGLCSADMYPLTPLRDVSPRFIIAVLLGHHFSNYAETVSARSGIPKMNREELASYVVALPPFPEQCAIAAILSDVDAEIEALKEQRDKTNLVKQGMMQELLTGKTRLVESHQENLIPA